MTLRAMDIMNTKNYRLAMIILLVCSLVTAFIYFIECEGTHFSVFNLLVIGLSPEGDDPLIWIFRKFLLLSILFVIFPIVESILLAIFRKIYAVIVGASAVVMNIIIGAFFMKLTANVAHELQDAHYYTNLNMVPIIIWVLLYVLMLTATGIIIWHMLTKERMLHRFAPGYDGAIDTLFVTPQQPRPQRVFSGAIIGVRGIYKGKGFALMRNEEVLAGSHPSDDILIRGIEEGITCFAIRYDLEKSEYYIRPFERSMVFLRSGQPLGKDRIYCIPRGMQIQVGNEWFELA